MGPRAEKLNLPLWCELEHKNLRVSFQWRNRTPPVVAQSGKTLKKVSCMATHCLDEKAASEIEARAAGFCSPAVRRARRFHWPHSELLKADLDQSGQRLEKVGRVWQQYSKSI